VEPPDGVLHVEQVLELERDLFRIADQEEVIGQSISHRWPGSNPVTGEEVALRLPGSNVRLAVAAFLQAACLATPPVQEGLQRFAYLAIHRGRENHRPAGLREIAGVDSFLDTLLASSRGRDAPPRAGQTGQPLMGLAPRQIGEPPRRRRRQQVLPGRAVDAIENTAVCVAWRRLSTDRRSVCHRALPGRR